MGADTKTLPVHYTAFMNVLLDIIRQNVCESDCRVLFSDGSLCVVGLPASNLCS